MHTHTGCTVASFGRRIYRLKYCGLESVVRALKSAPVASQLPSKAICSHIDPCSVDDDIHDERLPDSWARAITTVRSYLKNEVVCRRTAPLTYDKSIRYNQHARFKLREKEQMLVIAQSMGQNVMDLLTLPSVVFALVLTFITVANATPAAVRMPEKRWPLA